jgi:xanthine dehydrogenase/oxidase
MVKSKSTPALRILPKRKLLCDSGENDANISGSQSYVAQVMNVQANKVVTKVKRLGGGFGGKETRSIQIAGICALAAKVVGKPVRMMLNRDEDMMTSGQRHPFLSRWKVGVMNNGKIVALDADIFCNGGWTQDLSVSFLKQNQGQS